MQLILWLSSECPTNCCAQEQTVTHIEQIRAIGCVDNRIGRPSGGNIAPTFKIYKCRGCMSMIIRASNLELEHIDLLLKANRLFSTNRQWQTRTHQFVGVVFYFRLSSVWPKWHLVMEFQQYENHSFIRFSIYMLLESTESTESTMTTQ